MTEHVVFIPGVGARGCCDQRGDGARHAGHPRRDGRWRKIEESGHCTPIEQAQAFTAVMRPWLTRAD